VTLYKTTGLSTKQLEVRELALADLRAFINLVAPYQLLAHCHIELCKWLRQNQGKHKLLLWPRDHGKSRMSAFYAAWQVVRNPAITIIYASATAEKAEEQLRFIKNILSSEIVFRYFPGLINPEEGRRTSWNITSIIVDHDHRKSEGVIDSTIMTCGLEKTITGKHCDLLILDDVVVPENNTETGRKDVNAWVAQAASITSANSEIFAVGTRYHPKDAYGIMMEMEYGAEEDESGEETGERTGLFLINMANVEEDGQFLWPRQQRKDGKWFGFNMEILRRKRAVYEANGEITEFYAQYYNDPNDKSTSPIARELFQYYDKKDLNFQYGAWEINGQVLHVFAAVDLAASKDEKSDYTVIAIGGIDKDGNRYVLHIERYKTDKTSTTIGHLVNLHNKWLFKELRIEAVGGFKLVAQDLAEAVADRGIRIPVDLYVPPNYDGKVARVNGILEPLYQSRSVYHYRGGNCQVLEDELVAINPAHDDTKDAWAMCCELMKKPVIRKKKATSKIIFHPRFGGVAVA
jgi:predicted phage terminase large subunit-like protein